jgi:hypothetical protein
MRSPSSPTSGRAARRTRVGFLLACVALGLLAPRARAESEYEVKAAYLLNFAKLVEWPSAAFASGKGTLVIGVVGRGPVGDEVARTLAGASANGRPIEVRHVAASDAAALAACQVLFVPDTERIDPVLAAVQGRPVLVVGEAEEFARRGGAIGFVKDAGTVKFAANPKAAARNGLTVSAKLLRVAREVIDR